MSGNWSHPAFQQVARIVSDESGLSFVAAPYADVEARIRRAMARTNISDVRQYAALLETNALPLDDLLIELTVGETYFFRDPHHFDFIRTEVVPDVVRRRGTEHHIRVWSAGCASGEEAYSLAITLEDLGVDGHVTATDISRAALQQARDASYRRWALRGVEESVVARCFSLANARWTLNARFRQRVTFAFHNLARSACPAVPSGIWGMDLILCRNVLMYLDRASVSRVALGLSDTLAEDGWLITGPSDPPLNHVASLTPVVTPHGVFYRKASPRATATARENSTRPFHVLPVNTIPSAVDLPQEDQGSGAVGSRESSPVNRTEEVHMAFAAGRYQHVLDLTRHVDDTVCAALRVRAMANRDGSEAALLEARQQLASFPFSTELHLLQAVLLVDLKRDEEAARVLRRVLYLDRSLAIASFLLGTVLRRQGRLRDARRAYRNARDLARARPPEELLPLADGERAGVLGAIAAAELATLDAREVTP
jgi:chemotaxis protein methyltransferase CheR